MKKYIAMICLKKICTFKQYENTKNITIQTYNSLLHLQMYMCNTSSNCYARLMQQHYSKFAHLSSFHVSTTIIHHYISNSSRSFQKQTRVGETRYLCINSSHICVSYILSYYIIYQVFKIITSLKPFYALINIKISRILLMEIRL